MKRRLALAIVASLAIAAGIAVGAQHHGNTAQAAAAPQRPNVLVLETDDQTLAEMAVLPNVRRLIGDQGVTFDNNFDSFSLCCPSRASIFSGRYPHNHGVLTNTPPTGGFSAFRRGAEAETFAREGVARSGRWSLLLSALGYVLGAGISPRLIRTVFGLGSRVAFAAMARRLATPLTDMVAGRAA
jgi:hypothetical protein